MKFVSRNIFWSSSYNLLSFELQFNQIINFFIDTPVYICELLLRIIPGACILSGGKSKTKNMNQPGSAKALSHSLNNFICHATCGLSLNLILGGLFLLLSLPSLC